MQHQLPGVQPARLYLPRAAHYCAQRCTHGPASKSWHGHLQCSSTVFFNSLSSEIAIALFYSPASKEPKAPEARPSSSRWDRVGCPDRLHLPSPVQQSNAIKINVVFPLSLNLACGPQMIPIVNPFRKWTVERARKEERGGKEHTSSLLRNLEALGGGKDCVGSTLLAWWAKIWVLVARLSS